MLALWAWWSRGFDFMAIRKDVVNAMNSGYRRKWQMMRMIIRQLAKDEQAKDDDAPFPLD